MVESRIAFHSQYCSVPDEILTTVSILNEQRFSHTPFISIRHFLMYKFFKHWPTSPLCYKLFLLINVVNTLFCWCVQLHVASTVLHFGRSWERNPSHMALSEASMFFSSINIYLYIYILSSCQGVKGRGYNTLLKPDEANWDFVNMGNTTKIWLIDLNGCEIQPLMPLINAFCSILWRSIFNPPFDQCSPFNNSAL